MYANLVDCDPYTAGLVRKLDQVRHINKLHVLLST